MKYQVLISAFRSKKIISVPEVNVQSEGSITAVDSCFVANGEIIHSSKREVAVVF